MCVCCAAGVWNGPCGVFAGEQYIQSLCVQPGEGMSSWEDIEQQSCEIWTRSSVSWWVLLMGLVTMLEAWTELVFFRVASQLPLATSCSFGYADGGGSPGTKGGLELWWGQGSTLCVAHVQVLHCAPLSPTHTRAKGAGGVCGDSPSQHVLECKLLFWESLLKVLQ